MPRLDPKVYLDEEFEAAHGDPHRKQFKKQKRSTHAVLDEEARYSSLDALGAEEVFSPTYAGSRHEREWIFTFLGALYNAEYITDVLRRVKGGKEANVYVCTANPSTGQRLLAAKLYRPRMFRNLRNDARYRANRGLLDENGKVIHDGRTLTAVRKGSSYGKEVSHTSWLQHEMRTLQLLHDAGLPVPQPVTASDNTILMAYVGDVDLPAPNLTEVTLSLAEARRTRDVLIDAVEGMLRLDRIHGDLSAYNVLYWEDRPVIIDFPQAIAASQNPDARAIFERDVVRICQAFQRYGLSADGRALAHEIWARCQPLPEATIPAELEESAQIEE